MRFLKAQQARPDVFSMLKTMAFRAIMFYFIMQMFRRPQQAPVTTGLRERIPSLCFLLDTIYHEKN